jgi:tRNA modification GTPase
MRAGGTIAAIATAPGQGAVGIVRLSGPQARAIAAAMFRSARPGFAGFKPYRLHYGDFLDAAGHVLDSGLAAFMPGPGSYTGEDVVELFCHGGPALLRAVLEETLARGARMAEAGEFTYRAFRSGRLDLAQAEAVAETIAAPTRRAAQLAQMKLSGVLSRRIGEVRARLDALRAQLCLAVDFPDEDVEHLPPDLLRGEALAAAGAVSGLLAAADRARAWREGLLAVLAGRVNAGKSSLLNALLGRRRALVSDAPGTTRDYLEEPLDLDGLLVRLVDTAGLRRGADDGVEAAGQALSRELMVRADAVLYVIDAARPLHAEDREALAALAPDRAQVVLNKCDLPSAEGLEAAVAGLGREALRVSAVTGEGLETLCARLRAVLLGPGGEPDPDEAAPNLRQAAVLGEARAELLALAGDAAAGMPYDILGSRLDAACRLLAEITGESAPDDILDAIFSRFCIGK